ncbi:hypothetical protein D3C74_273290 [compost metagenome]
MKKCILIIIICFVLFSTINSRELVYSESDYDVSVTLNSNKEVYTKQFDVKISLKFFKKNLYNESVYLSYHFYDKKDNEVLGEGNRLPFKLDEQGQGYLNHKIDLANVLSKVKGNEVVIRFDFVDEKNVYWFSTDPKIMIKSDTIIYNNDPFKLFYTTIFYALTKQTVIVAINLLIFMLFIYCGIKIKKSKWT